MYKKLPKEQLQHQLLQTQQAAIEVEQHDETAAAKSQEGAPVGKENTSFSTSSSSSQREVVEVVDVEDEGDVTTTQNIVKTEPPPWSRASSSNPSDRRRISVRIGDDILSDLQVLLTTQFCQKMLTLNIV